MFGQVKMNQNFTTSEISAAINVLKNGKSAGADLIPAEFIKYSSEVIASDLTDIFNYMIEYREFPTTLNIEKLS